VRFSRTAESLIADSRRIQVADIRRNCVCVLNIFIESLWCTKSVRVCVYVYANTCEYARARVCV